MAKEKIDEKELVKFLKIIKEVLDDYVEIEDSAFFISLAPN